MGLLQAVGSILGIGGKGRGKALVIGAEERLSAYAEMKRLYDSIMVRKNESLQAEASEILFNYAFNSVNIPADFLASNPVQWTVTNAKGEPDEKASAIAQAVWELSGGESKFLKHAIDQNIKGDAVIHVKRRDPKIYEDDSPVFTWLDPSCVFPEFDPHDCNRLVGMVIAYEYNLPAGGRAGYYEEWRNGRVFVEDNGVTILETTYDADRFGGSVPAVWIANDALPGEVYGRSDIRRLKKLIEKGDHLSNKQGEIVDYYANPNIYVKGVDQKKLNSQMVGLRKMYFIPADGEMGFIEAKGSFPMQGEALDRIREAISELSEVPPIAFGRLDKSGTNLSGVAIRLLYGPLIAKTRRKWAVWGPMLERAMFYALRELGIEGISLDRVNVIRTDPLPASDTEVWGTVADQIEAGVSKKQILRERGYSNADIEKMETERADEAEEAAANFDAGRVPGSTVPNGKPSGKTVIDESGE